MADASYVQNNFLGGLWSKFAQGQTDRKDYRSSMNVCLNGIPVEAGTWVRRPGTRLVAPTRSGLPALLFPFEFKQAAPYNTEFTDGYLRLWTGPTLVKTNDSVTVSDISSANPAVVTTSAAHTWSTGNTIEFSGLASLCPLLQNRQFVITKTAADKFSIADAIMGTGINGSTLGWAAPATLPTVSRVLEFTTVYTAGSWSDLKRVQAEKQAIYLRGATKPYVLSVTSDPASNAYASFSLAAVTFKDGPYLDPFVGSYATPSAKIGVVGLTLSFQAYDSTRAYTIGDHVSYSGVSYESLTDQNQGNQPDTHAANWKVVNANIVVGPNGFQATDLGRHVRMFSEPDLWASGTSYSIGNVVTYNNAYYQSLQNTNSGHQPDLPASSTWWAPVSGSQYARWTWGKITGAQVATPIAYNLAGSTQLGDMTLNGGVNAAFDNNSSQSYSSSSVGRIAAGFGESTCYVGKDYSGASAQKIGSAIIYPSIDRFFAPTSTVFGGAPDGGQFNPFKLSLYASNTLPASSSDGTLLGTTGWIYTTSSVTINSSDQGTAYKYVWIEFSAWGSPEPFGYGAISEVTFYTPSTETTNGCSVQILGDPLLYTSAIRTWRLGLYSDTSGWPTCGAYNDGRLWLAGAVDNRFDASVPNDPFNFAPTGASGAVADNNAISYTLNSKDVNPIFWVESGQQGVVLGTLNSVWLVQATTSNPKLTPTNIKADPVPTVDGSADVIPADSGSTLLIVHRFRRKVQECFADVFSGRVQAQNVSWEAKHLFRSPLVQAAFQSELAPIMWVRCDDGSLRGMTYKRENLLSSQEPNFSAWHQHSFGHGRAVISICVGPSIDGALDTLAMITETQSNAVHWVEILTDLPQEGSTLADGWFVDGGIVPSSMTSSNTPFTGAPYGGLTLNGLWHLNGQTVAAWLGGLDCGDYLVTNGSITVPYGDGVSAGTANGQFTAQFVTSGAAPNGQTMFSGTMPAVVGFSYMSDGQILRPHKPEESGARNGPAFAKPRRTQRYGIQVEGTQGLYVGTNFNKLDRVLFKKANNATLPDNQTFTGIHRDNLTDEQLAPSDMFDSMLCWRVKRPFPCNLVAIGGFLQTQDA